jgi:phospholipid/cholesterol/gamma-HCH transport system substrate-binding protein
MGLLGDKFVEITSGSPDAPMVPPGGEIAAEEPTNVDQLIASGEDVMENVVTISHSLANILSRVDSGQGVLGELVSDPGTGGQIRVSLVETLDSIRNVAHDLESGNGTLGALLQDEELKKHLLGSARHVNSVLADLDEGDGLLPAMIKDAESKDNLAATLGSLRRTSESLEKFAGSLRNDDGLLHKLTADPELAELAADELLSILTNLSELSEKLNQGDGTLARLVNDPSLYDAAQDVVVGVEESRMLRWLIRNRQKAGIKKRYHEAQAQDGSQQVAAEEKTVQEEDMNQKEEEEEEEQQ